MTQLDLFEDEGPQPIQRWLHIWSEAERAARVKKPAPAPQWASTGSPPLKASSQERAEVMRLSEPSGQGETALPRASSQAHSSCASRASRRGGR